MIFKAKRYKWRAKNGNEHEAIGIIQTNLKQTLCSFDSPEQAEDVAHELLRVAAQWRLSSGRASEHTFGDTNRHVVGCRTRSRSRAGAAMPASPRSPAASWAR